MAVHSTGADKEAKMSTMEKTAIVLLWIGLYANTHQFFGNLYEMVAIAPNLKPDTLAHFRPFFVHSNPSLFYIPISPIGTIVTIIAAFLTHRLQWENRKLILWGAVFSFLMQVITVPIVAFINMRLMFGPLELTDNQIELMGTLWIVGNGVRMVITIPAVIALVRAVIWTHSRSGKGY
jgi:hypothetical protein